MLRLILSRVLIVFLSIAAGVVLVEALLRAQEPYFHLMGDRAEAALGRYRSHPIWHHWLRPHARKAQVSLQEKIWPDSMVWTMNAQGCRHSLDLTRRPVSGTRRIIVMGDSFTEGYYQEATFAAILSRRLNRPGAKVLYEVVNCGTASYSPLLHYLRYKHQLSKFRPHELIINIDLTDVFDDNYRYSPKARFASSGEPIEALPVARGLRGFAENARFRFYFVRLLFGRPGKLVQVVPDMVFEHHNRLTPDSTRWRKDVNYTLSLIQRIIDRTKEDKVDLTLTMYPYLKQYQGEWHRAFEGEVARLAQRNRVRFFSAYDAILPYYKKQFPLYWEDDFHFTPVGQEIWANVFADHYIATHN